MNRTVFFENIVREPSEERSSLFSDAFPDDGLSEWAAFKALECLRECWEHDGRELNRASVDFVTGTLEDTIKCLATWKRVWEAVVVADMDAELVGELLRNGDFAAAADRTNKIKALIHKFNLAELKHAREMMGREHTKIAELVDAGGGAS